MLCRAAYKWWSEAIDSLIRVQNAVHEWRSVIKNSRDESADLLKRCGLWGCLLTAIISSNIAQYVFCSLLHLGNSVLPHWFKWSWIYMCLWQLITGYRFLFPFDWPSIFSRVTLRDHRQLITTDNWVTLNNTSDFQAKQTTDPNPSPSPLAR